MIGKLLHKFMDVKIKSKTLKAIGEHCARYKRTAYLVVSDGNPPTALDWIFYQKGGAVRIANVDKETNFVVNNAGEIVYLNGYINGLFVDFVESAK